MNNNEFDDFEVRLKRIDIDSWQAYFVELPQISATKKDSFDAVAQLRVIWEKHKKECKERGGNIPTPISKQEFSGQFNTRVEPALHKALVAEAAENSMSLNAIVNKILKEWLQKKPQLTDITIEKIEISDMRITATVCVKNSYNQKVFLTFKKHNLGDELGDHWIKSVVSLEECFSTNVPLKKAIKYFLYNQGFHDQAIDCLLVSHKSISRATHGTGVDFPKDVGGFLVCKVD